MKGLVTTCVAVGLVLALGAVSSAGTVVWTDGGADHLWMNPDNWDTGAVPTLADEVLVDAPAAEAGNGPVIQPGDDAKALGIWTETAGSPELTMNGGTLEVADWVWWGDGTDSFAIWNHNGGDVTVANEFELGWGGGAGTLNMTGGTISARKFKVPTGSGAFAEAFISGGRFNVTGAGELDFGNSNGWADLSGNGRLVLEGDDTAKVAGLIAASQITGDFGASTVLNYYSPATGKTTVRVPEPATLSLLASLLVMGGVAWLRRRRA